MYRLVSFAIVVALMSASCSKLGTPPFRPGKTAPEPETEVIAKASPTLAEDQGDLSLEEEVSLDEDDYIKDVGDNAFSGPIRTDQHMQVATGLIDGFAAAVSGDASALLQAASRLSASGAVPGEDTPDVVTAWANDYKRMTGQAASLPDGPGYGPTYKRIVLAPDESFTQTNDYFSSMISEVSLVTISGEGRVTLVVSGRGNKVVCTEINETPGTFKSCEWTPKFSAAFTSTVVNETNETVTVYLVFT